MAATAAVAGFVSIAAAKSESGWLSVLPSTTQTPQWIELDLDTQLALISRQWLLQRTHWSTRSSHVDHVVAHKPLTVPDPTPKRSRRLPLPRDTESCVFGDIVGFDFGDERARQRLPDRSGTEESPLPPSDPPQRQNRQENSLFSPLIPESYCDLSSEDGFVQHGKKKKITKNQPVNLNQPEKKNDGAGDGGDGGAGGGDEQNGDAGAPGGDGAGKGDGGDKKDGDQDGKDGKGDPNPDEDAWGAFTTSTKKKKKGAKTEETTDLLGTETKFDTFDEIKLDTGPSLDLDFGSTSTDTKANSSSTWGSSWWGGKSADKTEEKVDEKTELESSPWSIDRPKPKKKGKTTFGFGSFDEKDEQKIEEPLIPEDKPEEKKEDDFGFGFATAGKKDKKKKKNSIWDPEPDEKSEPVAEAQNTGSAAVDDTWGSWGAPAKKTGKKGSAALLDPSPPPDKTEPADDFWGAIDSKSTKKKKKETMEPDPPAPDPPKEDNWGDVWGANKKDKDKKKKGIIEDIKGPDPSPLAQQEDDFWGGLTGGKKMKDKGAKPESAKKEKPAEDDLWNGLKSDSKKSSKKKKKGGLEEEPVKEPEPEPAPEPEPEPEPEPAPEPEPEPTPAPVVEEPSSAWSFWGATKKSVKKITEQATAELAPAAETGGDSWLNWGNKNKKNGKMSTLDHEPEPGSELVLPAVSRAAETGSSDDLWDTLGANNTKKKNADSSLPDTTEDLKKEEEGWGWGLSKKKSPPPAPTPPSLDMDEAHLEMDANVWGEPQTESLPDPAAAALLAEIEAEEQELSDLTIKSLKKKLGRKDQKRYDELTNNATRRADEAAAKAAEEQSRLEAEANAAAEALKAEQEAAAAKAEIEAEEAEIETLTAKSKRKKKFTRKDQERLDELTDKMKARAAAAAEANQATDAEAVEAAREAEEQAAREAEEAAAREAEEAAVREPKRRPPVKQRSRPLAKLKS
ncbi:hypothetical protein F5Y03DRAFT_305670 [Xylaria venustula]|nr:hypothetical protein F5Y03DRAFT_305670 [Xylaria venustula]